MSLESKAKCEQLKGSSLTKATQYSHHVFVFYQPKLLIIADTLSLKTDTSTGYTPRQRPPQGGNFSQTDTTPRQIDLLDKDLLKVGTTLKMAYLPYQNPLQGNISPGWRPGLKWTTLPGSLLALKWKTL